jgi:pimeloyl-ACP methyl ester carboxylesterase/ribosomal protein S18 acetylase RimI-like enzyme
MHAVIRRRLGKLSFITAGEPAKPAVLLLHGFPSSARMFEPVMRELSRVAHVIAPDLPGFGESDVLPSVSFEAFGQVIAELLDQLAIGPRYIYLHDFGAPVGLHVAMAAPNQVLGLIIQNANAHASGLGPQWADTRAFWSHPTPQSEAKATAHLTFEGTRDQYLAGVPPEVAARISPARWEEDWRVMNLPGRMETQRALVADYARYVARFDLIAEYLERRQPPAVLLWGRHDVFFDLAEVESWMRALPRMEAHVLDAGHLLLETHAREAASLMVDFVRRTLTAVPLTYRPALPSDIAACIELRGKTRENAVSVERLKKLGVTHDSWSAEVASGDLPGYVCIDEGRIVGYVFADKSSGEIVVLALLPGWEARGIGKRLLDMIVADLAKLGFRRLFLGCSADPKVRSYGFYRHLGWKSTGAFDANGDEVLELFIGGCGESQV